MEAPNHNDPKSIQHKEDKHPPRKPTKGDPSESGNQEVKERPNVQSQPDEGSSGHKKNSSERKSVVEEDCYESLVKDTPKKRRPERRTDLLSPAGGIITSAEILNARADQYGWLWRKVGMFRSRERFWALLYHKVIYLYLDAKDKEEQEQIKLRPNATIKLQRDKTCFLISLKDPTEKYDFQAVDVNNADAWVKILQAKIEK